MTTTTLRLSAALGWAATLGFCIQGEYWVIAVIVLINMLVSICLPLRNKR